MAPFQLKLWGIKIRHRFCVSLLVNENLCMFQVKWKKKIVPFVCRTPINVVNFYSPWILLITMLLLLTSTVALHFFFQKRSCLWDNINRVTIIISSMSRRQPQNNIFSGYLGGSTVFGQGPAHTCTKDTTWAQACQMSSFLIFLYIFRQK